MSRIVRIALSIFQALPLAGCGPEPPAGPPVLRWYVFNEPSGAFAAAASACSAAAQGAYTISLVPLPADADQQREQLVRRLAAGDRDVDLVGMDVIWTAEFAAAGWILPFGDAQAARVEGRLAPTLESASWDGRLWAAPFTTNAQLLWYRADRVPEPPATWDDMLREARALGADGTIEAQGARYEGLTVLFVSLLRSAGGRLLDDSNRGVSLAPEPTERALELLASFAASGAAPANFSNAREDDSRLAFEAGHASFMLNYTFVWPSAQRNAPEVARHMAWARWPRVSADRPSRVTLGGINVGVGAQGRNPSLAFDAAICLASAENQRMAARMGALPPTIEALYDDPAVRAQLPFADTLRDTLRDAVQRPQTPLYSDVSLAIDGALHPPRAIDPPVTAARLRAAVGRALRSEGLL